MTAHPNIKEGPYSVEEWLALEKVSDIRHEYYFGKRIPMSGESKNANRIANNLLKLLDDLLLQKGFELFTHDVKAEVLPNGIYRYPDVVAAPATDQAHGYIVKEPVLLVEIASNDSMQRDRVKKRAEYLRIPTLRYYLIISQDERWAELHSRSTEGRWETRYFTEPDEVVELPFFNASFSLAELYKRTSIE